MPLLAVENAAVAYVRGRVPEFEPTFQELLADEGYWELSSLHVFSELARWTIEQAADDVAARTLAAVEFVWCERSMRDGGDEGVDYLESLASFASGHPKRFEELRLYFGPEVAKWMASYGPGPSAQRG